MTSAAVGNQGNKVFRGLLRLTRVRFVSDKVAIAGAVQVDDAGQSVPSHESYSVKFPISTQAVEPRVGQTWFVQGMPSTKCYTRGHYQVVEIQVAARRAELKRPSGEHIVQMMGKSDDFPGINVATARKLWNELGEDLYDVLEDGDTEALANVVGPELANVAVEGWRLFAASDALAWLHRSGFEPRISRSLLECYGPDVRDELEADPYRVLGFGMSWDAADQLARKVFGLQPDDSRRLSAAVESRLFEALEEGHTALPRLTMLHQVELLLGPTLAKQALAEAKAMGIAVEVGQDLLASPGMEVVERQIANSMINAARQAPLCSAATATDLIKQYELNTAAALGKEFGLKQAQRSAVQGVAEHAALLITGGAGVGKTTVLRGIVELLEHVNFEYRIMTIAGRAARRAGQATGKPTSTIAGYLRAVESDKLGDDGSTPFALIVDEASMLDVLLCWRLIRSLPVGSRIILIGDPAQLPPIGPGLTLHAMVGTTIPNVELTQAERFGSEIAAFSREIRDGKLPEMPEADEGPVSMTPLPTHSVVEHIVDLYLQDPDRSQILAFTRDGRVSCQQINAAVQRRLVGASHSLSADEPRIGLKVANEEGLLEYTGLRRLDKVICNVNLHDEGLQNGSIGRIVEVYNRPVMRSSLKALRPNQEDENVYAVVLWDDGEERPVTLPVLDALELAYCITTHKSQGSQFDRVLVACTRSQLLDRAIVYTAVTRAAKQVMLIGDIEATRRAVELPPKATHRITTLAARLNSESQP